MVKIKNASFTAIYPIKTQYFIHTQKVKRFRNRHYSLVKQNFRQYKKHGTVQEEKNAKDMVFKFTSLKRYYYLMSHSGKN